jgi:hypothetical protein
MGRKPVVPSAIDDAQARNTGERIAACVGDRRTRHLKREPLCFVAMHQTGVDFAPS